jgi:hypothetical protein
LLLLYTSRNIYRRGRICGEDYITRRLPCFALCFDAVQYFCNLDVFFSPSDLLT